MERITIYVSKEVKEYLKKRKKSSISRYCRSAINSYIYQNEYQKKWNKTPRGRALKAKSARERYRKNHPSKTLECANPECHVIFTQNKSTQKYCSNRCLKKHWREKQKRKVK